MATKKPTVKEPVAMPMLSDFIVPKPDIQAHSVCTVHRLRVQCMPYVGKSDIFLPLH